MFRKQKRLIEVDSYLYLLAEIVLLLRNNQILLHGNQNDLLIMQFRLSCVNFVMFGILLLHE